MLNLLFHSSEAIVGGSPYNRTESELAAFCDRLERFWRSISEAGDNIFKPGRTLFPVFGANSDWSPIAIWTPLGSTFDRIPPATRSSFAEMGMPQDESGSTQSRSTAAGIGVVGDGRLFSPKPR